MAKQMILYTLLALTSSYLAFASDPAPLQDFCIADLTTSARVNGQSCKDSKDAQAEDFFTSGLCNQADTSNPNGFKATIVNAEVIPGLNTLGISMARLDFASYGINPPHTHPRATEILTVIEGSLEVGFFTSNPDNRLISKVLQKDDVFVFPIGLIHYQRNVNNENAVAISGLSSQNPGVISIPNAVFASNPKVNSDILAKAFQVDTGVINDMQSKL